MLHTKSLIILLIFFVFSESRHISVGDEDHNLILCPDPAQATLQLDHQGILKEGIFLGHVEYDYIYPDSGIDNQYKINCILVRDLDEDGTGGYPTLKGGGIGYYYVEIDFKSQLGKRLNFDVVIYGSA